jgi:very-short-patch-repair endonuclease
VDFLRQEGRFIVEVDGATHPEDHETDVGVAMVFSAPRLIVSSEY